MNKLLLLTIIFINTLYSTNLTYVGDSTCKSCHNAEFHKWQDSHHDLAMQIATSKSVLGDFNNASFLNNANITTTFFKKDSKFMVNTDGSDGKLHDFEISHTFGVYPLQQYMVSFPNGALQVLDIAWDSRSKNEGGQRWYHLHPHESISSDDVLHWSGPNLNWNFMCADCHSTNLKKNYDAKTRSYHTTWSSINVSCEACHGAGSEHLTWAKDPKKYTGTLKNGLGIDLSEFTEKRWEIDPKSGKAKRLTPIDRTELEVCAKCHSRRAQLDDDFKNGDSFREHYLPVTLTQSLYHSDGKIKDEVYVYHSFLQSKMYEEGVTCSDCHDPHSLERKAVGDKVCNQCHRAVDYHTPSHHKHKAASEGASCIGCHMTPNTYMGVDVRNDHSFRIPRPDLSVNSDIPNACNNCHKDENASWATQSIKKWYGEIPKGKQDFSHALSALHVNSEKAPKLLYEVLLSDAPNIAKATAVSYLGNYPNRQTHMTTLQMLQNSDVDIRLNALRALESFPLQHRAKATFKALEDSSKLVRLEAARQLSPYINENLEPKDKKLLQRNINAYEKTLLFSAERAESQTALASLYTNLKQFKKAELAFKEALILQPKFIPAYVNYADFLKNSKRDSEAYKLITTGLKQVPDSADLHHILGLWYIRSNETTKANSAFAKAAKLAPNDVQIQYVYAVAISEKSPKEAISILEKSLQKHTGDIQTLYALAHYHKILGDTASAQKYQNRADKIVQFVPKI